MGIKNNRVIILFLFSIASISSQCKKRFGCADTVYHFEIGVKAYPDRDSLNIGDTIWFEINSPDKIRDQQTNMLVEYSGVENLGTVIGIQKLDGGNFTSKALMKFSFKLEKGEDVQATQDPELFKEYLFENKNGLYLFKLGVLPLEKGIYSHYCPTKL